MTPDGEDRWADRSRLGPDPNGEQRGDERQDRDHRGEVAVGLLHQGVKRIDRSDVAITRGQLGHPVPESLTGT
jgi:hypothetical protein